MDDLLRCYVKELREINSVKQYDICIAQFNEMLCNKGYDTDVIQLIRTKEKYTVNKFSDESTRESMMNAKANLVICLESLMLREAGKADVSMNNCLLGYLQHFYSFLEAFREIKPNKKATLDAATLQNVRIINEYDLQHLLYAVLKPLFIDARAEVAGDTGCGTVRSDIRIASLDAVIETKCTRKSMSFKKLTEEIEADIVHYENRFIYFYVYDKDKIIKDRQAFESTFNRVFDGKTVATVVLQPVNV